MAGKYTIGAKIVLEGEKEYKQAINNCNSAMRVLKSELKAVSAEYANNANSLEALRAKNDLYTKQQSEQEKKLALLRGALEDATKQYGENSKQAQDWQIKLNNAYSELQKINRELDLNEKYMKEAEQSTDKTAKSIDEFGKEVKDTKEETLKFGDVLKANLASEAIIQGIKTLGSTLKETAEAAINVVKETAAYADNILTMSAQTGIATDTLQELNYMAELTDTSLETITSTMARNIRSMNSAAQGTQTYLDAYKTLGVEVADASGQLRDSETVYWEIIDALGKMTNETERDAVSMQIFGRSAQELNTLIAVGSDGVAKFAKEARDMGAVLSDDTLEKLGETDDAFQRLIQQWEISKRTIGAEMAPALTDAIGKVTEKVGEVDDKFAAFAGGAMEDVTDGFIWFIDNADLVISGLKGIAMALITKKAAEGIEYAVNAYKALTTATEAATTATTALNTVTKASAIGAIASIVVGLGTALYSYTKNAADAAEATRKLNDESLKLLENSKKLNDEVASNIKSRKEEADNLEKEYQAAKNLAKSLYDLADKTNKTNSEKAEMVELVKQLNKMVPDLNLSIDKQTGYLDKQYGSVQNLIEANLELQRVQLAGQKIAQIELDKVNAEQALNDALDAQQKKLEELTKAREEYENADKAWNIISFFKNSSTYPTEERLKALKKEYEESTAIAEDSKAKLEAINKEYDNVMKYLSDHSAVAQSASNLDTIIAQYKAAMEANADDAVDAVDDAIDEINDKYDDASKQLEKRLKREKKAFEEAQEAEVKAVEDAQDKELKALEVAHKKKLKLIDEEYLEKMKNVDEDRYKELKAVQDQIDAIDAQQEAEDRAAQLKEEAEKRGELQAKIANAETIEDKMEAQEELAKFEEDVAKDRLKTERQLQKDILEDQKDRINESYDAKIEALKDEQKAEEDKVNTEYEKEKQLIADKYELRLEALKKEQELEQENFDEKQASYREYLQDQKDLAIKNAKEIYEEDYKQFQLYQALKEKDIEESDLLAQIKRQAMTDLNSGIDQAKNIALLGTTSLQDALKLYTPKSQTPVTNATIDYDKLEDIISSSLNAALKKMDVSVTIDGKKFGAYVNSRVNKMIN
jgi:DNA repair exonuclease SbcCD ATPase subunit